MIKILKHLISCNKGLPSLVALGALKLDEKVKSNYFLLGYEIK